ncbi:MAG TPA: aldehyde dehydrogenase family protein [Acidimicrobiia bacterium]|nr:aldehyde dehydrogenase family protein [Acidimicrobiia bacterium]
MATATDDYRLLIGGEWVPGSAGSYGIVNPATEETFAEAPEASAADAEAAAQAARDALPAWRRTSPETRANLLQALADEIRKRNDALLPLIMAETGATLSVGSALQVPQAVARFERYAKGALQDISVPLAPSVMPTTPLAPGGLIGGYVLRQPVGVVACIAPYNFPLTSMAGKVGPALATGNTIVMKPPPQDPLSIIELARICEAVGFPPGVVNVVTGSKPEVGSALVDSRNVDMVSFTGSTAVGTRIYEAAGKTMKRLLMELGGKGACIVCDDADLQKAITGLVSVWAFHSGQICTAPTRAIVHRSVYDQLVAGLRAAAPNLKIGPPELPETVVGPVISDTQRGRIEHMIQLGVDEGGELLVDGRRPPVERGFFVGPTLLAGCTNQMTPVREEIFGPVIVVVPVDSDDEAVAVANDSDYGLYDYVFSEDTGRAYGIAQQLEAGHVGINTAQRNHEAPFGGFKMSGIGRDGGDFGLHAYTELQSIVWPG